MAQHNATKIKSGMYKNLQHIFVEMGSVTKNLNISHSAKTQGTRVADEAAARCFNIVQSNIKS